MREITVLVVEDNNLSQLMIKKLLTSCEQRVFNIKSVTDGKAAIEYVSQHEIDLMFLDVNIPKLSGLEVAKQIYLKRVAKNRFPIVAISGNLNDATISALEKMGVRDFVPKPFTKENFDLVVLPLLEFLR